MDSRVLTYISCLRMKYFTCNIRSHNFQDVLSSLLLMESYRMYKIIVFISVKIASFSTMSKRIQISWSNNVHSSLTRWPFFMRCSFFTKKHRFLQVSGEIFKPCPIFDKMYSQFSRCFELTSSNGILQNIRNNSVHFCQNC